jgi:ribonuclease-3
VGDNPSILEDVFESFIGATYLDQGREFAYSLTRSFFEEDVKKAKLNLLEDPKSMLQEAIQSESKESVSYKILSEEGPSNDKLFISGVYFDNQELGEGQGHSKKEAEFAAARDALAKLAKGTK